MISTPISSRSCLRALGRGGCRWNSDRPYSLFFITAPGWSRVAKKNLHCGSFVSWHAASTPSIATWFRCYRLWLEERDRAAAAVCAAVDVETV